MKDAFERAENRELYSWGKELEETYHRPVAEAERAARREQKRSKDRDFVRLGPNR